ncbi:MAG: Ig-like domain-containing protein [Actinomycetota bacterium]|nr:Ig-like domain-containing protein [Actinomycetota bacterium]
MWSRWAGGVIAAMVAIALCAGLAVKVVDAPHSFPSRVNPQPTGSPVVPGRTLRAALAAAVTFDPKPGALDVALDGRVVVNANAGRLTSVRAATTTNWPLFGTLSASGKRWQSNGPLAPGTSYRVTATVSGSAGVAAKSTSTFRTLTPVATVTATVFPDGLTVGVAQPIVIRFNHFIASAAARAAVLQRLTVTESRPVPGGWHWFNNRELHLRPKVFWPVGEKVTVTSDLSDWNAGNGMWGEGTSRAQFTIGGAHVAVANLATHQMAVTDNGRLIATYPFSGGRDMYPTMNGVHIVLDRQSVVHMVSSTNGIPVNSPDGYDELVYSDVHITDSGEYVHAAPWSVDSQGRSNVSHGCINLSPADALAFFGFSRVGDVVWVVGGPRPPERGDHGVMDWETKWNDWTPAVVHNMFPPPAAKTRAPASRTPPRSEGRR